MAMRTILLIWFDFFPLLRYDIHMEGFATSCPFCICTWNIMKIRLNLLFILVMFVTWSFPVHSLTQFANRGILMSCLKNSGDEARNRTYALFSMVDELLFIYDISTFFILMMCLVLYCTVNILKYSLAIYFIWQGAFACWIER